MPSYPLLPMLWSVFGLISTCSISIYCVTRKILNYVSQLKLPNFFLINTFPKIILINHHLLDRFPLWMFNFYMSMISNPRWSQIISYYFSMLGAQLWLPTQFVHLFFNSLRMAKEWSGKSWADLQSSSKSWTVFYFILSFVSVFHLRPCWIMCTNFDLISPITLAYIHSVSNYISNGYVSFSLWTY